MRLHRHPLLPPLALAAFAEALFAWRLGTPSVPVFDETHYLPAARALLSLDGPANREHPLLGKELIALSIRLFGDAPAGWRALSTLAGALTVVGLYAVALRLTGRVRAATAAALLAVLNFTLFVQARVAMLDGFMAAFVVGATASMAWGMRGRAVPRWTAGAAMLGLATACKWAAPPFVAYAALAFVLLKRGRPDRWPGLDLIPALLILAAASAGAYFLTFLPAFFYAERPMTLSALPPFQLEMFRLQTQVLPPHPYQSAWWSWPLMVRPVWYLYEPVDGAVRGVLMIGNPAVMWGGLVAVAACAWGWWPGRDRRLGAAAALWAGAYLPWAMIPKSLGFFYYYYLPSLWLPVAIAAALNRWARGRWEGLDEAALAAAALLFAWFYPILAATALPGPQGFQRWMWFPTWT